MSIVKLCRDVSFGLLCLCALGFLLAFSTSYWYHQEKAFLDYEVHHGIWRLCDDWLDTCFNLPGSEVNSSFMKATQVMMCIALGLYVAALVVYSIWASKSSNYINEHGATYIGILAINLFIGAGIFTGIGVAIFGTNVPRRQTSEPFGWSFAVALTSCICALVTSIPVLCVILICGKRGTGGRRPSLAMTPVVTNAPRQGVDVILTSQQNPGYPQHLVTPGHQPQVQFQGPQYGGQPPPYHMPGYPSQPQHQNAQNIYVEQNYSYK